VGKGGDAEWILKVEKMTEWSLKFKIKDRKIHYTGFAGTEKLSYYLIPSNIHHP
jgi:hypothetical protein